MANIKSAKKQARQAEKRRLVNLNRTSSVRTAIRKLLVAIERGEKVTVVQDMFREAEAKIARARRKTLHSNTAARKISRLSSRVASYVRSAASASN